MLYVAKVRHILCAETIIIVRLLLEYMYCIQNLIIIH